ncbi:unannotated protein [freshwater metagenome]|uniref:Unannotated protein n=1 Tax=freshwater metagenome TaxID=449393 RepID=A0A6J7AAK5_9ZZZZ
MSKIFAIITNAYVVCHAEAKFNLAQAFAAPLATTPTTDQRANALKRDAATARSSGSNSASAKTPPTQNERAIT